MAPWRLGRRFLTVWVLGVRDAGSRATVRLRGHAAAGDVSGGGGSADRPARTGSGGDSELARELETARQENARLRAGEAEARRLHKMARTCGLRIRDQLTADGVVSQAHEILETIIESDFVYLHLIIDGWVQPPVGHEHDWKFESSYDHVMPETTLVHMTKVFRQQVSFVTQDVRAKEGEGIPAWLRQAIRDAGVISLLVVPFGVGDTMLGYVALHRCRENWPFRPAEIDAVESVAADLGRGLNQARLHEKEEQIIQDLKALDQARSDFFATVSHELRSPLTSIEGYLELLSDPETGPLNPQQQLMVRTLDRSTSRLRRLIDDVFRLATLESGATRPAPRPVNLADLVSAAVDSTRPAALAHKLELDAQTPGHALIVSADAGQLDEVFANLLTNAVKFTPEGGRIQVRVAVEDGTAVVDISDTGIGIPAPEQDQLFGRFFRASNARQESIPGTGLGLAIAHSIITMHGGQISVSSEEGKGSTFTVQLPRTVTGWR